MRKKIALVALITIFCGVSRLQAENLPYADFKTANFGFTLGVNAMDFGIVPSLKVIDGKIYYADVSRVSPGFSVGIIGNLHLNYYFSLRLVPSLHLGDRTLSYVNDKDNDIITSNIKTTFLTVPLYLKYSSVRINNYRPYIIAGGGISFDLARDQQKPVLLKQMDYFIDFGVGCTFYFPFFRLSPEIKFALGFNDMLTPLSKRNTDLLMNDEHKFTDALSRLTSRMFTLTFNFE